MSLSTTLEQMIADMPVLQRRDYPKQLMSKLEAPSHDTYYNNVYSLTYLGNEYVEAEDYGMVYVNPDDVSSHKKTLVLLLGLAVHKNPPLDMTPIEELLLEAYRTWLRDSF